MISDLTLTAQELAKDLQWLRERAQYMTCQPQGSPFDCPVDAASSFICSRTAVTPFQLKDLVSPVVYIVLCLLFILRVETKRLPSTPFKVCLEISYCVIDMI